MGCAQIWQNTSISIVWNFVLKLQKSYYSYVRYMQAQQKNISPLNTNTSENCQSERQFVIAFQGFKRDLVLKVLAQKKSSPSQLNAGIHNRYMNTPLARKSYEDTRQVASLRQLFVERVRFVSLGPDLNKQRKS
ncbi:Hypothetical_protein [Hexamita inflata]|uniref:Hypothetical_protein n=1 Tax=Hexamita inflata TaxID=28002 RepID=A0AA86TM17_9EUKA|nr:Hypothetical protein HINF_LOCUS9015 [Hexamita inflata]CAI9921371.1 Hypothetical protein HINF_LOCUS9016 [Hexamita inflata]